MFILVVTLFSNMSFAKSLKNHPSPYLRMHESDPVQWQTWGEDVLQQAKQQNKLIYVSVGYFSCHWCHVMQKESYSNPQIGSILNEHFIAVKVDRELRPELDRRLIRFVESVRGHAGWPLNVFITPDGYPVTGFTYLAKADFKNVLTNLSERWDKEHVKFSKVAKQYFEKTENKQQQAAALNLPDEHFDKVVEAYVSQAMGIADTLQGGFGNTNKFPSYPQLNALLKSISLLPDLDPEVSEFVQLTLNAMSTKHLMDHVNYGFFRYTTDPDWQTPHFEKMLYDNAQLARLYFAAEKIWPAKGYAQIGLKTIQFMDEYLSTPDGGLYASLSAVDENNVEGGAYYWDVEKLSEALTKAEFDWLQNEWGFEQQASQIQSEAFSDSAYALKITDKLKAIIKTPMPVDTKALASWNALALKAFVAASEFSSDKVIIKRTQKLFEFMLKHFINDGKIVRFAGQLDSAETNLEDYAQVSHALQLYADYSGDIQAQELSQILVETAFSTYYNNELWLQNTSSLIPGDKGVLLIQDAVLESPLSVLLETVYLMQKPNPKIKVLVDYLSKRLTRDVLDVPYYYGSAILLRKKYNHSAAQ